MALSEWSGIARPDRAKGEEGLASSKRISELSIIPSQGLM